MNDINIGQKITEYRKSKDLSIRKLAEMSNITPSQLSQIEKGQSNPSINTLKCIANALMVPIFTFFVSSLDASNLVVRPDERKRLYFPESKGATFELLSPDTNGAIEFLLLKLPKNASTSENLMNHDGEEVFFVMEGKFDFYINDEIITLKARDSAKIPPHADHKFVNPYEECAKLIFAVTPPKF